MTSRARICLLGALVIAGGALASAPAARRSPQGPPPTGELTADETRKLLGPGFGVTRTERFAIISDGDPAWTRGTGRLLERTSRAFERFMDRMGFEPVEPQAPLVCVLIRDHAMFEAFALASDGVRTGWMGGYYATHSNRIVFFDSSTAPAFEAASRRVDEMDEQAETARRRAEIARRERRVEEARVYRALADRVREESRGSRDRLAEQSQRASQAKTAHEASHLLSFNMGMQSRVHQYPFWLSEGLAACFEPADDEAADRGRLGPDYENPLRESEFRSALAAEELVPLEALVEMSAAPANDERAARAMYAQAYALFRYLYQHERDALAALFRDIASEPPGMISPRRQGELFRARFGDAGALERRWLREAAPRALAGVNQPDDDSQ
ncbi:MAG: DUF1570 domain-containing protein [Planctomycetota bacterium]|nr:DUF1570 domain-containing protein [Planctomycetota bacterium]